MICATITLRAVFSLCAISHQIIYTKNTTWLLDSSCLLAASVIPFQLLDHGTLFVKWVFIMQTLHSLETRLNLQPYSKGQPVLFTRTLSCIQSKKWKWGKSTMHPGQLLGFCWRKRSVLPLVKTVATVYCCGSAPKMLPVSHGNLELAWNKLWANPAVLVQALCDLPLTPATKPTAEKQQRRAQALTDARFYLCCCYSVVARS